MWADNTSCSTRASFSHGRITLQVSTAASRHAAARVAVWGISDRTRLTKFHSGASAASADRMRDSSSAGATMRPVLLSCSRKCWSSARVWPHGMHPFVWVKSALAFEAEASPSMCGLISSRASSHRMFVVPLHHRFEACLEFRTSTRQPRHDRSGRATDYSGDFSVRKFLNLAQD
jgi:hypothetical protein